MDKEYILNLQEGEEINDLVAERVMGWHKGVHSRWENVEGLKNRPDWLDADGHFMCGMKTNDGWYEDDEDFNLLHWHPSESILWTWEIIEKIQDRFSFILSYDNPPTDDEHKWFCELYAKREPFIDYEAHASTASLAICRAALLSAINL